MTTTANDDGSGVYTSRLAQRLTSQFLRPDISVLEINSLKMEVKLANSVVYMVEFLLHSLFYVQHKSYSVESYDKVVSCPRDMLIVECLLLTCVKGTADNSRDA